MRMFAFAGRNRKEILRDPLSLVFGVGFPVALLGMMTMMQHSLNAPVVVFGLDVFTPGMAVFGLSFISLFLGMLVAGDRSSSFLMRLFASPLTGAEYILGYLLPMVPVAIAQSIICFGTAVALGLPFTPRMFVAILALIPVGMLFIGFGLLIGSNLAASQVGGIASILVNVSTLLSGTWFPLDMMGGTFHIICYALPFAHAVDLVKAALAGDYGAMPLHLLWVLGYAVFIYALAIFTFGRHMRGR